MVDDDIDDRFITESVLKELDLPYNIHLDYLDGSDDVVSWLLSNVQSDSLPDVILLDLKMPGKSGFELLIDIKSNALLKTIPIIVISGTAFPKEVHDCYKHGANTFIEKPKTTDLTEKKIRIFFQYWFEVATKPRLSPVPNVQ